MSNLNWSIVYTKQGLKDKKGACESEFEKKINNIIEIYGPKARFSLGFNYVKMNLIIVDKSHLW